MRQLPQAVLDALEAERAMPAALLEAEFSDPSTGDVSVVRVATTRQDVDVPMPDGNTETFRGGGEFVNWGGVKESVEDQDSSGTEIALSGVDPDIINTLLSHHFRGHEIRLWLVFWDEQTGQVEGEPLKLFDGFQLSSYEIVEDWGDNDEPGSVGIKTSVRSFGSVNRRRLVVTNPVSHNRYLQRIGQAVGDVFFSAIPSFAGKEIFWGRDTPDPATGSDTGRGGGGRGGGGRGGGGHGESPGPGGDPFKPWF